MAALTDLSLQDFQTLQKQTAEHSDPLYRLFFREGSIGSKLLSQVRKDLADVVKVCEGESNFRFLYDLDKSIEEKIEIISKEIYGADGIELSERAQKQVDTYTRQGYSKLPSA